MNVGRRRRKGLIAFLAGYALGFVALTLAVIAILMGLLGIAATFARVSKSGVLTTRFETAHVLLATPIVSLLALGLGVLAVCIYRRL